MPKATPVTLDGITTSIRKHSIRLGIPYNTVVSRRMKGDSPEEALRPLERPTTVEVGGEMLTLKEIGARVGITPAGVKSRLKNKTPLTKPKHEPARYEYKGEMLTVREIAEREGVSRQAIDQRLGKAKRKKHGNASPGSPPKRVELDGILATIPEHAARLGVSEWKVRRIVSDAKRFAERASEAAE